MTVEQLIKELEKMPKNKEIFIYDDIIDEYEKIEKVRLDSENDVVIDLV